MITLSLRGVKDIRANFKDNLSDSRVRLIVHDVYNETIDELDTIIECADTLNMLTDDVLKVTLSYELIKKIRFMSLHFK